MKHQKKALTAFLEDRAHLDVPGNALIVCRKGKELYRHFTGDATEDTLFRICSMTKIVTVVSAMQLLEQGLFTMEDPVSDYLPEFANPTVWDADQNCAVPAKNIMRVRHLFSMSAGLTYPGDWCETARRLAGITDRLEQAHPNRTYTSRDYVRAMAEAPLAFEPGTHWNYSLCHDVLGVLVEVLSGQTLGDYMHDHIFAPLGMKNTFFRYPEGEKDRLATGCVSPEEDTRYLPTALLESGGAGLLSTADDYMRFASTLTNGGTSEDGVRILGRKTIDLMRMDQLNADQKADFNWDYLNGYSYGMGVRTLIDPARAGLPGTVGEFGWCGFLGTWVLMDPAEGLTAVYMHQRYPNLEKYVQTHLRPMIYAML